MILHLVTDLRRLCAQGASQAEAAQCLVSQARFAVDAGVDAIQIREPHLSSRDLCALAGDIVKVAAGSSTRVLVNDRLDVALACGAHGVHLRGDSVAPRTIRRITPAGFLVGRSVHRVDEAMAVAADVNYLIAGAVWATESKPSGHPTFGIEGLAAIVAAVRVPVLAIGGVSLDGVARLAETGAAGVAAIGLFMGQPSSGPAACRAAPLDQIVRDARRRFDTSPPPS